jgi:hypothetical protein
MARATYRALLKLVHGPKDPRVEQAMYRGQGLVRMEGFWAPEDLSRPHRSEGLLARLQALPAVSKLVPGAYGHSSLERNDERVGQFQGVDDLSRYGYVAIQPVRGMKIFHQYLPPVDRSSVRAVVAPPALMPEAAAPYRPRYRPPQRRMPLQEAERLLLQSFPGIDLNYLRLLIAARGCSEGGTGQPPLIARPAPARA